MPSEQLTNSEIVALYDARPESILVRQSDDMRLAGKIRVVGERPGGDHAVQDTWRTWTELDALGRAELEHRASSGVVAHLKSEGVPLSLLFGRNGAGKSRFLESIQMLQGDKRALLASSVLFRFPSEDDSRSWSESVFAARDSEWLKDAVISSFGEDAYETNSDFLEEDILSRIFELPFVDAVRRSLLRDPVTSGPDFFGLDRKSHLELLGFSSEAIRGWVEREEIRWGPNRLSDDTVETRPFAFARWPEVRSLGAEFYFHYASRMTVVLDPGLQSSYGEHWTSTIDWIDSTEHAVTVGPAVEEFMAQFTHVELLSQGLYRFLAPVDAVPMVLEYIKACGDFVEEQNEGFTSAPNKSLPLDLFRIQDGGEYVESSIMRLEQMRHVPQLVNVVDLTFPDSSSAAMSRLLSELVSRHLELSVVIPKVGSDALGLWLEGYDGLRTIGEKVSALVNRCEAGIDAVRIRGFERDVFSWAELKGHSDSHQHFSYFGGDAFGGIPRPFVEWKDANSGVWFGFDQASLGQRQLMLVFFAVELLMGNERRSPLTVVIGDEIDRNLHWRASSRMLEELNELLGGVSGMWVIFSTHTVPALGSPRLAGINRIFAAREGDGFSFVQSRDANEVVMSEILGVSPADALRFADLLLVVEGDHDELVITDKLLRGHPLGERIQVVNAGGLYAWNGILSNTLQHLDAPVLFVYDKRNEVLESEWEQIVSSLNQGGILPRWETTMFAKLKKQIKDRRNNRRRGPGDDEASRILLLLEHNVFEARGGVDSRIQPNATLGKRLHFHGLEVDDVVDLLPIKYFPEALNRYKSWERAHSEIPSGEKFKDAFDIKTYSVMRALQNDSGSTMHPELKRLLARINMILSRDKL